MINIFVLCISPIKTFLYTFDGCYVIFNTIGMSYDWIDFMLYVSDNATSIIYAVSMETLEISEVPMSLESPAKVVIVPLER